MEFPITIIRKKIKNMYFRVYPDGSVTVSAPKGCSDKVIRDFVDSKSDWIMNQLKKIEKRKQQKEEKQMSEEAAYISGEKHYYWGYPCLLMVEEATRHCGVTFEKNPCFIEKNVSESRTQGDLDSAFFGVLKMHASKNSTVIQRKHLLEEFYREQLKLVIPDLMEHYSDIVGKKPAEWRIRNMKTRWGTCNVRDKRIWLSLNLAKKPLQCLDYVIVHELTHLHVPNHSKAFWMQMDIYYPEWKEVRKLLKENEISK